MDAAMERMAPSLMILDTSNTVTLPRPLGGGMSGAPGPETWHDGRASSCAQKLANHTPDPAGLLRGVAPTLTPSYGERSSSDSGTEGLRLSRSSSETSDSAN
jgi:hypothetical protein